MQRRFLNNTVIIRLLLKLMLSNYVYTDASALTVIPSWNNRQNGSYPCNLSKDSQNVTTFTGDSFQTCKVKLILSNNTPALLYLSKETSLATFLYAEIQGDLVNCQSRFLAITDVIPCSFVFWHREIQLFLEGNISIFISEIPVNRSSSLCPKPVDVQEHVKHRVSRTNFCRIKEFNHSVSCTRFPDNSCVFYDFPYNCEATLNDIEVVFQCYDDGTYSNYTALLMCPTDVISLYLTAQNIVRINGSPFRRLQNLRMLELSFNKLSIIDPHTFQELHTLIFLSLRGNHLLTLNGSPFQRLQSLKTLELDFNKLSFVDPLTFKELDTLTVLFLSENHLVTLHVKLFTKLHMLRTLDLHFNNINNLPLGIFQNLVNLGELYLDRNNLTFLHQELFSNLTVLTHLTFYKNMLLSVASDSKAHLTLANDNLMVLPRTLFKGVKKLSFLFFAQK